MNFATYVINLPRDRDRLFHMQDVMGRHGIPFELLEAVDGRSLTESELSRWVPRAGTFRMLIPGEIGCFLSHRKIWETIITRGHDFGIVLEDDIHLAESAGLVLADLSWFPRGVDVVRLETWLLPVYLDRIPSAVIHGHRVKRLRSVQYGTGGYVVSRLGAEKLLATSNTFVDTVDDFIFNPGTPTFRNFVSCQMDPAICIQDLNLKDDSSALGSGISRVKATVVPKAARPKGIWLVWREIKRAARKLSQQVSNLVMLRQRTVVHFGAAKASLREQAMVRIRRRAPGVTQLS